MKYKRIVANKPMNKQLENNRVKIRILIILCSVLLVILFYAISTTSPVLSKQSIQVNSWPPVLNQSYPDIELIDQEGEEFKLSYLKGKVIIVEPIGMNCPACQAFSGGHEYGAYRKNRVEEYSYSFSKIFPLYSEGLKLPGKDIVFVQLLLYNEYMGKPTPNDARKWAKHFELNKNDNHIVAVSNIDLRGDDSFKLIPGFQLIDKNFVLRIDSTGHNPKHDLYKQLIPMTKKFVDQKL